MISDRWIKDIKRQTTIHIFLQILNLWGGSRWNAAHAQVEWHLDLALAPKGSALGLNPIYRARFCALNNCDTANAIWQVWAPLECKLFLWLVMLGRIWTTDGLAKRNLPHNAACPFRNSYTRKCPSLVHRSRGRQYHLVLDSSWGHSFLWSSA